MMSIDPISPIGGPDDLRVAQAAKPAPVEPPPVKSRGTPADESHLKSQSGIYAQRFDTYLSNARYHLNRGEYDKAQSYYMQFINDYRRDFRLLSYARTYELPHRYFFVLQEIGFAAMFQNQEKRANQLINEELQRLAKPVIEAPEPEYRPVQELFDKLIRQRQFPSEKRLNVVVPPEALDRIVQQLVAAGDRPAAINFLGFIELRHVLSAYQAYRVAVQLSQKAQQTRPVSQFILPFQVLGLPVAPYLPITAEDLRNIHREEGRELPPESLVSEVYRVDPISPVRSRSGSGGKNSREHQEEVVANWRRQVKQKTNPKKPRMTF